jgi:hypothetical protein
MAVYRGERASAGTLMFGSPASRFPMERYRGVALLYDQCQTSAFTGERTLVAPLLRSSSVSGGNLPSIACGATTARPSVFTSTPYRC